MALAALHINIKNRLLFLAALHINIKNRPLFDEQVLNTMPFQDQTEGRPEWAFWGRLKLDRASSRPTKNRVKPTTLGLGHPSLRTLRKTSFFRFQAARIL